MIYRGKNMGWKRIGIARKIDRRCQNYSYASWRLAHHVHSCCSAMKYQVFFHFFFYYLLMGLCVRVCLFLCFLKNICVDAKTSHLHLSLRKTIGSIFKHLFTLMACGVANSNFNKLQYETNSPFLFNRIKLCVTFARIRDIVYEILELRNDSWNYDLRRR